MKTRLIGLAAGLAFGATLAFGQQADVKPWGVSVNAGAVYTDNRDGRDVNKESNIDFYIEPRADLLWRDGERTLLDFFVAPQVKVHSNPHSVEEGDPQHDSEMFGAIGLDLGHRFSRLLAVKLGDTAVYNDDPEITDNGVSVRSSANHVLNTASADLLVAITPSLQADLGGRNVMKRYEDDAVAAEQDEDVWDLQGQLGYLMAGGTKIYGLAGYSDFSNKSPERDRGSRVLTGDVGVEKTFTPDFVADLAAGYQSAEYDDETVDSQDTMNVRGDVALRGSSATRFRIGAIYGFAAPNVRPYSLQKMTSFIGSVEHDVVPKRLTVNVHAQYTEGKYEVESDTLAGGKDKMTRVGAGASYWINRHFSVNANYNFEHWDSDVREPFDRNTVDVGVAAKL